MKKNKIIALLVTLVSSSLVAVMAASIAWFSSKVSVTTEDNLTGSSDGAYFAYGDGTHYDNPDTLIKEGPYGIETPRQLYNLAWLQYLGYFNTPKNGVITPVYFELNADIDMTGWILPPIGTTLYPFIGEFNGNGHTITNLTVSNDFNEIKATNKMPSAIRRAESLSNVNIVGMFGVIGELDNNITATYDSSVTSVSDFTIAGATIKNSLSETLAGIAAGYVNGPLKNVAITSRAGDTSIGEDAVMASRITTAGAANFDDYTVTENNATVAKFKNISEYGVVGYCEEEYLGDDDHFAMVVGDVSGKGVPAALFMVITKTLLKDTAEHEYNPAKVFEHVNKILCEGNESGLFVTCWMAILTISTGELNFANAGHNAPVIKTNGEIKYLSTKPNLMLAAMDGIPYTNNTIKINTGDRLFIYTDGITEATNDYDELYGEERLLHILKTVQDKEKTPRDILDIVRNDLNDFVLEAPQFDDITMLSMVYKK